MKKLILLSFFLIFLTSFVGANNQTNKIINTDVFKSNLQETRYKAYFSRQNKWYNGYVYINEGRQTDYQFENLENTGSVQGKYVTGQEKFYTLNPNNPLAINYNFTHYVDVAMLGRIYIIAN
jgi:hypothetical protein